MVCFLTMSDASADTELFMSFFRHNRLQIQDRKEERTLVDFEFISPSVTLPADHFQSPLVSSNYR